MNKGIVHALILFTIACKVFAYDYAEHRGEDFKETKKLLAVKELPFKNGEKNFELSFSSPPAVPELEVRENFIQLSFPQTTVWPKIEREFEIDLMERGKVIAYPYTKESSRVRFSLPKLAAELAKRSETKPRLQKKGNSIFLSFIVKNENLESVALAQFLNKTTPPAARDEVAQKFSAVEKEGKRDPLAEKEESFSPQRDDLFSFVLKFALFIGLIVGGSFLLLNLFKRKVLKKGKLSFLSNQNTLSVITQTYLGPKRSLILVKAESQVFLIASSETGINFLSEIKNPSSIMKASELEASGNNFDSKLADERRGEIKEFPLKEHPPRPSSNVSQNASKGREGEGEREGEREGKQSTSKDEEKFSEQIRSKLKSLRPLQ